MRLWIRQHIKMFLQHIVLPAAYRLGCFIYRDIDKNLIVFADAHHTEIPFSMQRMYEEVRKQGFTIKLHLYDYSNEGNIKSFLHSISFMFLYAKARCVFICDNFLPAASCKKRSETTLVQLWHSCGLLKKMGYDTAEDVPSYYKGNVYANYDLVTVSAPACVPYLTSGMKQPADVVRPLGVSRTDVYFDSQWMDACRNNFYRQYPDAIGKKILLWAPTFRGNASNPELVGQNAIHELQCSLDSDWFVIKKVHPHLEEKAKHSNDDVCSSCTIPTEQLLPITDLLITDYSSILFDYLFLEKPFVLFAPDLDEYEKNRGFYIEYPSLTTHIAKDSKQLVYEVNRAWADWTNSTDQDNIRNCRLYHNAACDGHSTERILDFLRMRNN